MQITFCGVLLILKFDIFEYGHNIINSRIFLDRLQPQFFLLYKWLQPTTSRTIFSVKLDGWLSSEKIISMKMNDITNGI